MSILAQRYCHVRRRPEQPKPTENVILPRVKECPHHLKAEGSVVSGDEKKAEVFHVFFASVSNIKISCPQDAHLPEMEVCDGEMREAHNI